MKLRSRIAALNAALFAMLLAVSPADSGSMTLLGAGKTTAAVATTTFDSGNSGTNGALSGGNLVWTATGASAITRSVNSHSTGKYYFELTATTWDSTAYHSGIGLCNSSQDLNVVISQSANSLAYFAVPGDPAVYDNNINIGNVGASGYAQGDVIGVAVDVGASLIWYRKNGGAWNAGGGADPATATGGFTLTIVGALYAAAFVNGVGNVLTANFGATAYGTAAPSGFGNF